MPGLRIACVAAALLGGSASPADARLLEASGSDRPDDGLGAASQEIVGASASYDTAGRLEVRATMAGDIADGPPSAFSFGVAPRSASGACAGSSVHLSGESHDDVGSFTVPFSGPIVLGGGVDNENHGPAPITRSGRTIVMSAVPRNRMTAAGLQNRDYACVTVEVYEAFNWNDYWLGTRDQYDWLDVPLDLQRVGLYALPRPRPSDRPSSSATLLEAVRRAGSAVGRRMPS